MLKLGVKTHQLLEALGRLGEEDLHVTEAPTAPRLFAKLSTPLLLVHARKKRGVKIAFVHKNELPSSNLCRF